MIIELKDVALTLDRQAILSDINLTIERGDFLTLIGPNGAGKTSLLRLIAGLEPPTSGKINRAADLKFGYVPQAIRLDRFLPLRVKDFISLYISGKWQDREIVHKTRLIPLLEKEVASLSGGELQRVLLARTLLLETDVLLLDEPVQWLDYTGHQDLYRLIIEHHRNQNRTVILVSHDLHWVLKESHRVLCLNKHICCEGTPDHVRQTTSYRDLFPDPLEFTTYTHHHDHSH